MVKGELPPIPHKDQAMTSSIQLTAAERKTLLTHYRTTPDPQLRLRSHILLLLAQGLPWATITAVLFCSSRTIARWQERFLQERVAGLATRPRGGPAGLGLTWVAVVVTWVTTQTPRAFGFLRSRWCCAVVALLLWQRHSQQPPGKRSPSVMGRKGRWWCRGCGPWSRPAPQGVWHRWRSGWWCSGNNRRMAVGSMITCCRTGR